MARDLDIWLGLLIVVGTTVAVAIGFAANLGLIGALIGVASALITDPIVVVLVVIIGLAMPRVWIAIVAAALTSVIIHFAVRGANADIIGDRAASWEMIILFGRMWGMVFFATILALLVALIRSRTTTKPSP